MSISPLWTENQRLQAVVAAQRAEMDALRDSVAEQRDSVAELEAANAGLRMVLAGVGQRNSAPAKPEMDWQQRNEALSADLRRTMLLLSGVLDGITVQELAALGDEVGEIAQRWGLT